MEVRRHADADAFLARAGAFLLAREAEHNLMLGLAGRLRRDPEPYGQPPWFATVERDGRVVAAALRTPPHNLVLSEVADAAAPAALAEALLGVYPDLPGVIGPKAAAAAFVRRWEELTGVAGRVALAERIYRAATSRAPEGVTGRMRPLEPGERDTAVAWMQAFMDEVVPPGQREDPAGLVDRRLAEPDGDLFLWDDGGAVSFCGFGSPTPNGIRIGPVYTPPDLRGRGYAGALTAAVTQMLLDGGRRFCFLFTDLANPTSNALYVRIGYEPVTDVDVWRFS